MDIDDASLEILTGNVLSLLTYWIPFAEITEGPGHGGEVAMGQVMAGVLHQYLPYLQPAEARQVEALARDYLA